MTEPSDRTRAIELEVEVPGTPEEVWEAVATGPGITSWYIPMEVEQREGGTVTMDWGSFGSSRADVAAWEPPHRVVFRSTDDPDFAFEWLVEARDGGTCVVRLINSGFGEGDEWDEQYHGMSEGWNIFLQNLRLQLTHFRGRRATAVIPTVALPGPNTAAWASFCDGLGVPAAASIGDRIATSGEAPPLGGRVERVMAQPAAHAYLLLLDVPHPGTGFVAMEGDGEQVSGSIYLYLYGDDDAPVDDAIKERWFAWLSERFSPAQVETIE